jgi:hypothetical protein
MTDWKEEQPLDEVRPPETELPQPDEEYSFPQTHFELDRPSTSEDVYLGRPERWFLGSIFRAENPFFDRLAKLQSHTLYKSETKRISWEQVIGPLSKFFPAPTLDQAVQLLLTLEGKMPSKDELVLYLLGAIDGLLRSRHLLIPHETLLELNQLLALTLTRRSLNKFRFQLCKRIPALRPRDPHKRTNRIMQRIAIRVLEKQPFTPVDKRWALQRILHFAQRLVAVKYYPGCPEVYGYALALLLCNVLRKVQGLPRCRIPSPDPKFRKQVSQAMLHLKKVLPELLEVDYSNA